MPALQIGVGESQCAFIHTQVSTRQPAICTMGFNISGVLPLQEVAILWGQHIVPEINHDFAYTGFRAMVTGGTIVDEARNILGGGGGEGMTPQVCYLIRKVTGAPGRENHGRLYLPGTDEPSVDATGVVSAGKRDALNAAFQGFLAAVRGLGPETNAVILHTGTELATPILSMTCETVVATQRRRLKR